ncbi:MAG TPA: methylated-DNA--[protein]-cysteine methyltransferase [Firmicutes bacterium]|jgi:methylated-DNA-[protein]-cysteine S-methyltransferase|nr:methylated-DNA--[protein]-cysteine methyltransferase [Bacillota bacterium]
MYAKQVMTPLGPLFLRATEKGLSEAYFGEGEERESSPLLEEAARQVSQWFSGERREFDLALDLRGTEFQRSVWKQLQAIPRGQQRSYGQIANTIGKPGAARAVGSACGANPIILIIPCHRVLAADGSLGGFSAGLDLKRRLLAADKL